MTPTGLGLMKLPSLGSSAFDHHTPISTITSETLTDRRRASITDPCLHAHSNLNQVNQNSNFQSSHEPVDSNRSYTLPSCRELSRHSKTSTLLNNHTNQNTLQPLYHSLHHVSTDPAAARRRGSAADLDHILLNSNTDLQRPQRQQIPDPLVSPTAIVNSSEQQVNHHSLRHRSSQPQPYNFNSFSFDSSLPSVHLPSHSSNTPVSPRSFSSVPSTNQSEANFIPLASAGNRRPISVRRRSSRANELDVTPSEDPVGTLISAPGPNGSSDHTRTSQSSTVSQWPYPIPHHRHHLQKPSAPVKRRGSSQSISESMITPQNCISIPSEHSYGPLDQPWNTFRLISNESQHETVSDSPSILNNYRLDARRQSEASSSSSTGLSYNRRESGESGACEGSDDNNHNLPSIHFVRRRSWSPSSKQNIPPFSPNQTTVTTCMSDYSLPTLPFKEQTGPSPAFTNSTSEEQVLRDNNRGWYSSLEEQTVVEDVYDLKDKLAATRLLDRLPHHSHSVSEANVPSGQVFNQQDKPCNPYSRSPELKISHKLAERKRRKEMRDLFDELREVLPVVDERHSKGSKWETLSRAVDYMQQLRIENEELKKENLELQSQIEPTKRGILNGRQDENNSH